MMSNSGNVLISAAFLENAIQHLTRALQDDGYTTRRLVLDRSIFQRLTKIVRRLPLLDSHLGSILEDANARRDTKYREGDIEIALLADIVRIAGGRRRNVLSHRFGNASWKVLFGRSAGRVAIDIDPDVVVGMPGSSLEIFTRFGGAHKVLHVVDSHPAVRNEALYSAYGATAKAECYPDSFIHRVQRELKLADSVLVPSRYVEDQMLSRGISKEHIIRIPYGVDMGIFTPFNESPQHSEGVRPYGSPIIVFVGQVSMRKGIPTLIEAATGLDVTVEILGPVFDRRLVEHCPDNVRVLGVGDRAKVRAAYQRADAFVMPSIDDSFGLVCAEAAACGLPVITTPNAGAHEFLDRARLVEPGSVSELRTAMKEVRRLEPEDREKRAEASRNLPGFLSWEEYSTSVIQTLANRSALVAPNIAGY